MNTNIKTLTNSYLDTINGISASDKSKIAQFNSQSEWVIFAADSLGELDVDSVMGLSDGESWRGIVRADEQGFLLVDLSNYPPSLHTETLKKERLRGTRRFKAGFAPGAPIFRHYRADTSGYYRLAGTKGRDWKLDNQGYVLFWDQMDEKWVYHQHVISNAKSNNSFRIEEEKLGDLLEEVWKTELKNAGTYQAEEVYSIIGMDLRSKEVEYTNKKFQMQEIGKEYLHTAYYSVFPEKQRSSCWLGVPKKFLAANTDTGSFITSLYPSNYQMFTNLEQVRDFVGNSLHSQPDTNNIPPLNPNPPHTTSDSNPNAYTITTEPFKITKIEYPFGTDGDLVRLFPQSLTVDRKKVEVIIIIGEKTRQTWQVGDTIILTNITFEKPEDAVEEGELFLTSEMFGKVKINSTLRPNSSSDSTPPPSYYPETRQKNQELNREEDKMILLAEELLKVIEDNNKICQEAQQLGLNLPEIPTDALNYFEETFFKPLDEDQSLNSSHNSQIITKNEIIRQKKLNIKKNIYGICDNNKKKLAEKKTGGQTPPPKNELEKLKQELKERINQVLTNKDNLRNIDLSTLANGKYQNWEKNIEGLTTQDEVVAYANAFLAALKETGAKEEERGRKGKGNKTNSNNSQNSENNTIDDKTKKIINSLPLAAAKNAAKIKIRELFNKYNPDLEKIKELWGGEKNWMAYLEKCDSPEKIVEFLEKLERAMLAQQIQSKGNNKNKKPAPKNSWILPLLIIVLVALISLVIIIKLRYKRKKIK